MLFALTSSQKYDPGKTSKSLTLHHWNLMGLPSTVDCFYSHVHGYRIYRAAKYLSTTHTTEYLLPKEGP